MRAAFEFKSTKFAKKIGFLLLRKTKISIWFAWTSNYSLYFLLLRALPVSSCEREKCVYCEPQQKTPVDARKRKKKKCNYSDMVLLRRFSVQSCDEIKTRGLFVYVVCMSVIVLIWGKLGLRPDARWSPQHDCRRRSGALAGTCRDKPTSMGS